MTDLSRTPAEAVRPLAVVTGASSGIGYELGRLLADDGYDLVVAADTPLAEAVQAFEGLGARVDAVEVDLATEQGVQSLIGKIAGRPVDVLAANAGHGLGKGFLDERFEDILHVIDTNVTGTVRLVHLVGGAMRDRGQGRILFTGSIAGLMPGSFQAVYNASKAFVDSFSFALRNELKDSGVSVTVLMPGVTDTEFFERAGLMDTKVGQSDKKMDPADVARIGYEAMRRGDGDVVAGMSNKLQAAMAAVTPQSVLAEQHRKMAEPGSGQT
ncbi:SDR family NAD(P)-dependent oxidoreductase [Brevundimonas sp. Root1279]|uniref:SDR family NAD(P)-dependent oxidoreductase n=1 Tax=Brevundimonas sp. Root1279 TaxID=1736443 RepID=UPI0006FDF9B9|nr:SDR family NAD(P)-dependent oxidoreductase [Brevundimonas sp. Root1279]KQW80738.1 oxidoreductase [Brevundimonas sp. Root1279]